MFNNVAWDTSPIIGFLALSVKEKTGIESCGGAYDKCGRRYKVKNA